MNLDHLSIAELDELNNLLRQLSHLNKTRRIDSYFTDKTKYLKHREFFAVGKDYRQRLFRAANRVGKSTGAAYELTCHLTGHYPDWWEGKRFDGCTSWWVCGKSSETVRQILQPMLLGQVGEFGTGMIPAEFLDFGSLTDAKKANTGISTIKVKHKTGSYSQVEFKSYEAGRGAFEGTERNIWCDEEPPLDVYSECLLRTMTGDCILMMTFTPLRGASEVVMSFAKDGVFEDGEVGLGKYVVSATWDDVPHLSEQAKAELWESTPPHQRDARSKGIPALGSGVIYPVSEDEYLIEPFQIPDHWPRLYGMDVGGKTAAVWTAKDPDTNILYTYSSYYKEREEPSIHAAAIKGRGDWIPGAIDPASRGRSQIDGQQLMQMYKDLGLNVVNAINGVETGLYTIWELLSTGQLKVFKGQDQFMREIRSYARDEKGHVIKKNDHCFTGDTKIWTDQGHIQIKDLVNTTGRVMTIAGYQDYYNCRLTRENTQVLKVNFVDGTSVTCTPDHKFLTTSGWIEAQDLVGYNTICIQQENPWKLSSLATEFKNSMVQGSLVKMESSAANPVKSDTKKVLKAVQSIEFLTKPESVYCLTVPYNSQFALANGVIVHNCMDAWRYSIMTRDIAKTQLASKRKSSSQAYRQPVSW